MEVTPKRIECAYFTGLTRRIGIYFETKKSQSMRTASGPRHDQTTRIHVGVSILEPLPQGNRVLLKPPDVPIGLAMLIQCAPLDGDTGIE